MRSARGCLWSFLVAAILVFAAPVGAKDKTIRGFITDIVSADLVAIDQYRVHLSPSTRIEVEDPSAPQRSFQEVPRETLIVGAEVEVRGALAPNGRDIDAVLVRIAGEDVGRQYKQSVYLHEPVGPLAIAEDGSARGDVIADGRRIRIEPRTIFGLLPPGQENVAEAVKRASLSRTSGPTGLARPDGDIGFGLILTYDGARQADGSVLAASAVLAPYRFTKDEAKLWAQLTPRVTPPIDPGENFRGREGELKVDGMKWKIYPDERLRQYVENVGQRIIPPALRAMSGEEGRLDFRFFIVEEKYANAFCLPNGVVGVNTAILRLLENEAQLASVMAHEIAHATQRHVLREMHSHTTVRTLSTIGAIAGAILGGSAGNAVYTASSMVGGAVTNGYSRNLENQADRIGLQYMVEGGYDPRQAPQVWEVMTRKYGDQPTNFFWSNHDSHAVRRSYLMTELRANYATLEFDRMRLGTEEFLDATERVRHDRR